MQINIPRGGERREGTSKQKQQQQCALQEIKNDTLLNTKADISNTSYEDSFLS